MKPQHLTLITAVAWSACTPSGAVAQTTRVTVLHNAPITAVALPGASASVRINSAGGAPPPGQRTVVLTRPVTAVSLPGWESHIRIASR